MNTSIATPTAWEAPRVLSETLFFVGRYLVNTFVSMETLFCLLVRYTLTPLDRYPSGTYLSAMPNRLVHKMRFVGAIMMIALYVFCAALTPAMASMADCSSHPWRPCQEAMHTGLDGAGGPHTNDGMASADKAMSNHDDAGKSAHHADLECQLVCSGVISAVVPHATAHPIETSITFVAITFSPDDRSPEVLIRPPNFPLAQ